MFKRTKCTVGKRKAQCSFARGHPECRYAQGCRWPLRGKDETHPYKSKREQKRGTGDRVQEQDSWIENFAIAMHNFVFKRCMSLTFKGCKSVF